ncbi:hypothetical protein N7523_010212 [Penicillium sp. IBT 18751x]|nr:hypothetical protein N7523_010212 [Penicillium sp. IBT 18751x]
MILLSRVKTLLNSHDDSFLNLHDDSLLNSHDDSLIKSIDNSFLNSHDGSLIKSLDNSFLNLHDDSLLNSLDDSLIKSLDKSLLNLPDDSLLSSHDDSLIKSIDNSFLNSHDDSLIKSLDNSLLNLPDDSLLNSHDDSLIKSIDDSLLNSLDDSLIKSLDKSLLNSHDDSLIKSIDDSFLNSLDDSLLNLPDNSFLNSHDDSLIKSLLRMFTQAETVMFGLDTQPDQYRNMLKKANVLIKIRDHLEADRLKMMSFLPSSFDRSSKKKLFKKNITTLINQGIGSQTMKALFDTQTDKGCRLDCLVLILFSLSDNHFQEIEKYELVEILAYLLRGMMHIDDVSTMMMKKFAAIFRLFGENDHEEKILLERIGQELAHKIKDKMVKANQQVFSHEGPPRKRGYEESSEQEHNAMQYLGTEQDTRRQTELDSEALAPFSIGPEAHEILGVHVNQLSTEHKIDPRFNHTNCNPQRHSSTSYDLTAGINENISHQNILELAFFVPLENLNGFYELHKKSSGILQSSAILTIPTQDRVASLVLSIPRLEAVAASGRYKLPVIFNSEPPST